jgi:hypothetical protein
VRSTAAASTARISEKRGERFAASPPLRDRLGVARAPDFRGLHIGVARGLEQEVKLTARSSAPLNRSLGDQEVLATVRPVAIVLLNSSSPVQATAAVLRTVRERGKAS